MQPGSLPYNSCCRQRTPRSLYMLVVGSFIVIAAAVRLLFSRWRSDFSPGKLLSSLHRDVFLFTAHCSVLEQGTYPPPGPQVCACETLPLSAAFSPPPFRCFWAYCENTHTQVGQRGGYQRVYDLLCMRKLFEIDLMNAKIKFGSWQQVQKKTLLFTVIIIYGHTHTQAHTTSQAWNYLIK